MFNLPKKGITKTALTTSPQPLRQDETPPEMTFLYNCALAPVAMIAILSAVDTERLNPSRTQWVPAITTHVTTPSPAAGANDSDIATVVGVPADFSGTIRLDIFRFVPGGSVQLADACQPAMLGATLAYSFTGPGDHVSPDYAISAQEVAGVQYVNQETLLTNDGRELAVERCATAAEVVTITRPLPPGRLTKTT